MEIITFNLSVDDIIHPMIKEAIDSGISPSDDIYSPLKILKYCMKSVPEELIVKTFMHSFNRYMRNQPKDSQWNTVLFEQCEKYVNP
jgi:hypothetical protein